MTKAYKIWETKRAGKDCGSCLVCGKEIKKGDGCKFLWPSSTKYFFCSNCNVQQDLLPMQPKEEKEQKEPKPKKEKKPNGKEPVERKVENCKEYNQGFCNLYSKACKGLEYCIGCF